MFVVYENATTNQDPLLRGFNFKTPVTVRHAGKEQHIPYDSEMPNVTVEFKVKRRGRVYADRHPESICATANA
ncbi:hypothetical protein [Vibrio phage vB_pir03]|nr:hypothetical protein [Vibrio phage vB_pir03]